MSAVDCPDCKDFLEDNNLLRTEVERLKIYQCTNRCTHVCHRYPLGTAYAIEELEHERDEALDALSTAQQDLVCGQHEGYKMVWCIRCIEAERAHTEASAILDRLQRAEAVVEAAKSLVGECYELEEPIGANNVCRCAICGKVRVGQSNAPFPHTVNCEVYGLGTALAAWEGK